MLQKISPIKSWYNFKLPIPIAILHEDIVKSFHFQNRFRAYCVPMYWMGNLQVIFLIKIEPDIRPGPKIENYISKVYRGLGLYRISGWLDIQPFLKSYIWPNIWFHIWFHCQITDFICRISGSSAGYSVSFAGFLISIMKNKKTGEEIMWPTNKQTFLFRTFSNVAYTNELATRDISMKT